MKLLLLLLVLVSSLSFAKPNLVSQVLKNNTIMYDGVIERNKLAVAAAQMTTQSEIYLYIDSPGGDFEAAKLFVRYMAKLQSKGRIIHCYGGPRVASAAFYIYLHCDRRYALQSSVLFPHKIHVYFAQPTLPTTLMEVALHILEEQNLWDRKAIQITGMEEADYIAFRDSDDNFWSIKQIQSRSSIPWFTVVDYYEVKIGE